MCFLLHEAAAGRVSARAPRRALVWKNNVRFIAPKLRAFLICSVLFSSHVLPRFFPPLLVVLPLRPPWSQNWLFCPFHARKLEMVLGQHVEVRNSVAGSLEDNNNTGPVRSGIIYFTIVFDEHHGIWLEPARVNLLPIGCSFVLIFVPIVLCYALICFKHHETSTKPIKKKTTPANSDLTFNFNSNFKLTVEVEGHLAQS